MSFSESVRLEVKRKAAFQCCRCHSVGVEVHHIIPKKYGGSDEITNAAPLCPNCHTHFGDNPTKRKEITQMRDWWYEMVENMYPDRKHDELDVLNRIDMKLNRIQQNQSDISELKPLLKAIADRFIEDITPETAITATSGIVNATTIPTIRCNECGHMFVPSFESDNIFKV